MADLSTNPVPLSIFAHAGTRLAAQRGSKKIPQGSTLLAYAQRMRSGPSDETRIYTERISFPNELEHLSTCLEILEGQGKARHSRPPVGPLQALGVGGHGTYIQSEPEYSEYTLNNSLCLVYVLLFLQYSPMRSMHMLNLSPIRCIRYTLLTLGSS